jgi:autotransporter-associated beta strand protein
VEGQAILFTDDFTLTAANPNTEDVNFQNATRQSGTVAPLTYTKGGEPTFSQVGNGGAPNALLLAGRSDGLPGAVSPDYNFIESPGLGDALTIQFDVNPVQIANGFNTTATSWICIDFGSTAVGRNLFPQDTDGIGLLFRGNRQTQAFDNGTFLSDGQFAPTADTSYHHIEIQISNAATGDPFAGDGTPDLIQAFSDYSSVPFLSYTRLDGFSSDYLSFIGEGDGSGGDGVVRHELTNLEVSILPVLPAATPVWNIPGGGSWGVASNWLNDVVPQNPGDTANFTSAIAAPSTVTLDGNWTVGNIIFNNGNSYTIAPGMGGSLVLNNQSNPSAITDNGGSHTISAPVQLSGGAAVTVVNAGDTMTISGSITGSGGVSIAGAGMLSLAAANSYLGTTTINSGTLLLAASGALPSGGPVVNNGLLLVQAKTIAGNISGNGTLAIGTVSTPAVLQLAPGNVPSTLGALTINSGSTFDITSNALVINYGSSADPVATIRGYLKSAYNGGIWTGSGLTSSTVATQVAATIAARTGGVYGIGYADGSDAAQLPVVAVGHQLVYEPALIGDANLDGSVTFIDLGIVAQNLGATNSDWEHGDFNYDGTTNFLDIGLLAQNLNYNILNTPLDEMIPDPSAALTAQWNLAVAEIQANSLEPTNLPEPGVIGLLAVGATGLLTRRRSRSVIQSLSL